MAKQKELAKRSQDTRDSIRGKNNYRPAPITQSGESYWPKQNAFDLPTEQTDWRDNELEII